MLRIPLSAQRYRYVVICARIAATSDAARVTTTAPYTGAPLADLPVSTPADVETAFGRARTAQKAWAATSMRERKETMLRFHDLVVERQNEVVDLIQAESGKTRRDAFLEVTDIAISRLDPRRRQGAGRRCPPARGHGQRQRRLRRRVGKHRLADGRHG
ncbi:aldehyde dehydrogenase family protein [Nocardia xishanensis]|uniref:Aldehyde dehydrogenase family protein n=1 Tax=Nocardia xishanensis TaxID=238964 RepID=A0ABW7X712_9NOCA